MLYGYTRVSTKKQSVEKQIRNIKAAFPDAVIIQEEYTGVSFKRPEWSKLYQNLKENDIIIFDSVIRMSRNAYEGFQLYKELYKRNVGLVFLKERHIDTAAYCEALEGIVAQPFNAGGEAADDFVNSVVSAINRFMMNKVEQDIYKAFKQAEKEAVDLRRRTREGIETARLNGKQIGSVKGSVYETRKSKEVKPLIRKYSRDFDGTLTDVECIKLIRVAPNTYYKYKRELKAL